jgi:hypothetical protein
MSELAAAYYTDLAEAHNIDHNAIPEILDGTPLPLLDPGERLSIHHPQEGLKDQAVERYQTTILGLSSFLLACAFDDIPEEPLQPTLATKRHFSGMVEYFLSPKYLSTGILLDISMQAVTPDEVSSRALRQALGMHGKNRPAVDAVLNHSALFIVSANIKPRSALSEGYTASLSIARVIDKPDGPKLSCGGSQFNRFELKYQQDKWRPHT